MFSHWPAKPFEPETREATSLLVVTGPLGGNAVVIAVRTFRQPKAPNDTYSFSRHFVCVNSKVVALPFTHTCVRFFPIGRFSLSHQKLKLEAPLSYRYSPAAETVIVTTR
jgi:hypothetical protein